MHTMFAKMYIFIILVSTFLVCVTLPHYAVNSLPTPTKFRNYSSPTTLQGSGARSIKFPVDNQILNKWAATSMKFFDFDRCVTSHIASSEDECFKLNQIQRSEIAIYFGGGQNVGSVNAIVRNGKRENFQKRYQKVVAVFPDSNTPKSGGSHDAILVLDPYPKANFGHLVAVFYIDQGMDSRNCREDHQIFTTDDTCITVAKKSRCPNRLERYTGGGLQPRRCHIDFLPSVYLAERFTATSSSIDSGSHPDASNTPLTHDLLNCINLPGFAQCPRYRPLEDTRKVLCDASTENSKRCDTSHAGVGTRCKLFQTCDHAVLIGGGWNRLHSDMVSFENIIRMQESLSSIGFVPENIKTFYANGKNRKSHAIRSGRSMYDDSSYFSSVMKTGLRGHLRTICEARHCADTLYIYLNNPTTVEGDMLLWDADYNGMVDELEVYTAKEFLSDILGCEARRVVILADQSNSDVLLSSLKESKEHANVMILTAGLLNQVIPNGELTNLWANHSDSVSCIKSVFQRVINGVSTSTPTYFDSTSGVSAKVSLIGAPCDLIPPVNTRELKVLYEGCQNVPTSVWFSATFEDIGAADYDAAGGMDESEENSPNGRRT